MNELTRRILSASCIVAGLVWATVHSQLCFQGIMLGISACIFYEWIQVAIGRHALSLSFLLTVGQAFCCFYRIRPTLILSITLWSITVFPLLSFIFFRDALSFGKGVVTSMGIGYIFVAMSFFMQLYQKTNFIFILWIFTVIWSTDTGALIFGKLIGGKKLMPRVSPGKTWAGFLGGTLTATFLCLLLDYWGSSNIKEALYVAAATAVISVFAHLGDLLESKAKRYFRVKDLGWILPGHGGMADRFDSLLMVSWLLFFAGFFKN